MCQEPPPPPHQAKVAAGRAGAPSSWKRQSAYLRPSGEKPRRIGHVQMHMSVCLSVCLCFCPAAVARPSHARAHCVNVYARRGWARRRRRECVYERVFLAGPRARARRSGYLVSYTGAPEEGRDAGPMKGGLPLPSNVSGRDRFGRGVRAPALLKGLVRALRPRTGPNRYREDR